MIGESGDHLASRGEMMSVYCRDPDGSLIEIATMAKPKRDRRRAHWQSGGDLLE